MINPDGDNGLEAPLSVTALGSGHAPGRTPESILWGFCKGGGAPVGTRL